MYIADAISVLHSTGVLPSSLLRVRIPNWVYTLTRGKTNDGVCHLLPRDPVWLAHELPVHIARGIRIANRILHDPTEAEEVVAEALSKTQDVEYVPKEFGPYFYRVVRNTAIEALRKRLRRGDHWHAALSYGTRIRESCCCPEMENEAQQVNVTLHSAIESLDEQEQVAIKLHYLKELSIKDTAKVMQLQIPETQNILRKARQRLRVDLSQQFGFEDQIGRFNGCRCATRISASMEEPLHG